MTTEKNYESQKSNCEGNDEKKQTSSKLKKVLLCLLIAIISYVWIAEYVGSPEHHEETIEALEEKRTQVLEMSAFSTALSMGVSALPKDMGTPIAQKLADISTYLMLILCAIYLEKYLVTLTGYAAFKILIPVACLLFIIYILWNSEGCLKLAKKVFLFGIAICLVVPTSVRASNLIEDTYQLSIEVSDKVIEEDSQPEEEEGSEKKGLWDKVKNSLSDLVTNVEESVTQSVEKVKEKVNIIIEGVAVMIVTSCIMPIAILFFFTWIIRIILGVDVNFKIPKVKGKVIKIKKKV